MSGPARWRKRPVEVEAVQFDGGNGAEVAAWCGGRYVESAKPSDPTDIARWLDIPTLEGTMRAQVGDWIIRGTRGEFYPVKPGPFEPAPQHVEPQVWHK